MLEMPRLLSRQEAWIFDSHFQHFWGEKTQNWQTLFKSRQTSLAISIITITTGSRIKEPGILYIYILGHFLVGVFRHFHFRM